LVIIETGGAITIRSNTDESMPPWIKRPAVYTLFQAQRELDAYINLCDMEITGLGCVNKTGNTFVIEKLCLLDQKVNEVKAELSQDALHTLAYESVKSGKSLANVRLWWHSHVDMPVKWSMQDEATIENLGATADWFISIVGNKAGEYNVRLDIFKPVRWAFLDLGLRIKMPEDRVLEERLLEEMKNKVKGYRFMPRNVL